MGDQFVPPTPDGWTSVGLSQKDLKMQPDLSYPSSGWAHCGTVASPSGRALFSRSSAAVPAARPFPAFSSMPTSGLPFVRSRNVDPAGASGLGNSLARLAVDDGVEENGRARRVVIPDVVVHLLEMPGVFAGLGI